MNGERVLQLLQDVEGVVGSFVSDRAGELRARLSPPEFSEAALRRTASRVGRIVRCAELCELDVERCELRLGKNQLLIFCFTGGMLGVLVQPPVSKRALGMAARLAIRELAPPPAGAELEADDDEVTSLYPSARRSVGDAP
jgi:hypothetical protein